MKRYFVFNGNTIIGGVYARSWSNAQKIAKDEFKFWKIGGLNSVIEAVQLFGKWTVQL